jgi:hypothetical protein
MTKQLRVGTGTPTVSMKTVGFLQVNQPIWYEMARMRVRTNRRIVNLPCRTCPCSQTQRVRQEVAVSYGPMTLKANRVLIPVFIVKSPWMQASWVP